MNGQYPFIYLFIYLFIYSQNEIPTFATWEKKDAIPKSLIDKFENEAYLMKINCYQGIEQKYLLDYLFIFFNNNSRKVSKKVSSLSSAKVETIKVQTSEEAINSTDFSSKIEFNPLSGTSFHEQNPSSFNANLNQVDTRNESSGMSSLFCCHCCCFVVFHNPTNENDTEKGKDKKVKQRPKKKPRKESKLTGDKKEVTDAAAGEHGDLHTVKPVASFSRPKPVNSFL